MAIAFSIDPDQGLSADDEIKLVQLAAELGYDSAWTPSRADTAALNRCMRWHEASNLPTGISAVPASDQSAEFYATHALRLWQATSGAFTLVLGSGQMSHAAEAMRAYLDDFRARVPADFPVYLAALGPRMLEVAGEMADGVALNWCSSEQVSWSRKRVEQAARRAGRPAPRIIEYIRTAVDDDPALAERTVALGAARYVQYPAYHKHFERMGVARDLERVQDGGERSTLRAIHKIGAAGRPGETRHQVDRLASGLDLPIVRVLVVKPGDYESARRVLEECRPT
jgi:alkanesulfonate monooxygenase SsuD/methylene tetrahydromethanopterin reductase-like flavin-dependent oxidoreductase (luciferase family)